MMTVDEAADLLHCHGWTTGTYRILDLKRGPLWVVEASLGEYFIQVRAEHAVDAWEEAGKIAAKVG